jgi:hypothetical protein
MRRLKADDRGEKREVEVDPADAGRIRLLERLGEAMIRRQDASQERLVMRRRERAQVRRAGRRRREIRPFHSRARKQ